MRLISSSRNSQKSFLPVLLSLLPCVMLKPLKSIRLFFQVIFLYNNFLIFLINIYLSMHRSFIVPEGACKAKTTSVVFLILKKTFLPAGSVSICSIGGAVILVSTKAPQTCVFPGKIKTSPSQGSLMSCRWEKLNVSPSKWRCRYPKLYSS